MTYIFQVVSVPSDPTNTFLEKSGIYCALPFSSMLDAQSKMY